MLIKQGLHSIFFLFFFKKTTLAKAKIPETDEWTHGILELSSCPPPDIMACE